MHRSTEKGTQMSNQNHTVGSPPHRLGVAGSVRSRAFPGASAPSITKLALALVLGVLVVLALSTTSAQAAIAHKYISQFTGAPAGSFSDGACGVTVDPATQDVYVVDPGSNAIDIFEPAGAGAYTYKSQISGMSVPGGSFVAQYICSVAVSDVTGDVYLASESAQRQSVVYVFNALGTLIETLEASDVPIEQAFNGQLSVAVDNSTSASDPSKSDVYIGTVSRQFIYRFSSQNKYLSNIAASPYALTTDSSGDIYATGGNSILEFNASGSKIVEIATPNSRNSGSVAVDPAGDVYVAGRGSAEEFNPAGEFEGRTGSAVDAVDSVAVDAGDLFVAEEGSPGVVDIDNGPGVVVPDTTVQAPSSVGSTTAVANGSVNPADIQVSSCEFEYGTSTAYGQSVPCEQAPGTIGSGTSPVPVTATLSPLQPNTTYYYRLNAANANGNANEAGGSGPETFTTPGIPKIVSESAEVKSTEKAGQTHATLTAQVNPDGRETTYHFEYGQTESYGSSTAPGVLGSGEAPVTATAELSGLKLDTTYHYRVVASNECEVGKTCTAYGPDQKFTTVAAAFVEDSVSDVTGTSTTLNARVDPLGSDTRAYFQYGTVSCAVSPASCTDTPEVDLGSAEGYQALSVHLQGLTPSTTYYYRVIATNALGTVEGEHNAQGEEVVHTFTTQPPGASLALPDDRQWELVSPPDKHGALIRPIGEFNGVIQAAANGDAFTYGTSAPTELQPRGYAYGVVQVLSRRGASASSWSSQNIETPNNYETGVRLNKGYEYRFFSPDLSLALVEPVGAFTPLQRDGVSEEVPPRASERTEYLRSDFTCQATPATCYTPLVTEANTPAGTKIGGNEEIPVAPGAANFLGATPDLSHVVLKSSVPLIEGAPTGNETLAPLYEWSGGRLQPVSVLPASEGGAWETNAEFGGTTTIGLEARNAVSTDGSRVVWSDPGDHGLYMSDTAGGKTESVRIGGAGAEFTDAGSDDSKVFFVQGGTLNSSGPVGAEDLYVFEVTSGAGEPLAGTVTRLTEGAEVKGTVLGSSEDGSYVYFVANGVLGDGAAHGASAGNCGLEQSFPTQWESRDFRQQRQTCNLYVDHYNGESKHWEAPSFIAARSGADGLDSAAWILRWHTSRVSPDGRYLAFMSDRSLTGYDNVDQDERPTANEEKEGVAAATRVEHHDQEIYLYDAVEHKLVCASCNPTGARPAGVKVESATYVDDEMWEIGAEEAWLAANVPGFTPYANYSALYQSRYLSNSGRLFFNSHEALVPQDVNGQWDVYEYEPPVGAGGGTVSPSEAPPSDTCTTATSTYSPRSAGCVGLISSGESAEESAFLDASENGDDVFFLTSSRLSSQDLDDDYDVYDAHVCGAEGVACAPTVTPPPPCTTEASCKPSPEPPPGIYGPPASATFNGPGNLEPPPPAVVKPKPKPTKCHKGFVKNKKSRCVRRKSKKRGKQASHNGRIGR
jgi:hypothetical protein